MTIENSIEGREIPRDETIWVYRHTIDALREVELPRKVEGGCSLWPQRYLGKSAEDPNFYWQMEDVNRIAESLPYYSSEDLAELFGRIMIGLRRGQNLAIGIIEERRSL